MSKRRQKTVKFSGRRHAVIGDFRGTLGVTTYTDDKIDSIITVDTEKQVEKLARYHSSIAKAIRELVRERDNADRPAREKV